jgi:hypothetical protein
MFMSPVRTQSRQTARRQRGAVAYGALLAAGLVLVAAATWVVLSTGPSAEPAEDHQAPAAAVDPVLVPEDAELEEGPKLELPGQGDLLVELDYLGSKEEQHLRVQRQGLLVGKVYGAFENGAPIDGAVISVYGGPQDGLSTRTDQEGNFELSGLIPGTHFFRIDSAQSFSVVRMQRVIERNPTKRDFFLGRPLDVEFLVRDHENKPLANARVLVDGGLHEALSNDKGLAMLGNIVGGRRVLIDVRAQGFVPVRYEMNLFADGLASGPVELPPLPRGGTVRGRIKSWPGGALPTVTLVPRATQPGAALVAWETWQDIEVDREGRFVIENVPTTHLLDIRAYHPWGVSDPRMRAVTPSAFTAANISFVIRQSKAKITGTVYGPDGQPKSGVDVRLLALHPDQVLAALYPGLDNSPVGVRLPVPAQMQRQTVSARDGTFEIAVGDHVQGTGSYVLLASAQGMRTTRHEVQTVGQDLKIRMKAQDTQASVTLERIDEGPLPASVRWKLDGTLMDTEGLALGNLQEGLYRVKITRGNQVLRLHDSFYVDRRTSIDLSR